MLGNLIQETANSPGSAVDVSLLGAPPGRRAFGAKFASGAPCFYQITDGLQWEIGVGTYTAASPNKLSRTTVLDNSAGSTARLSFTGTVIVFNDVPAERMPYLSSAGVLPYSFLASAASAKLGMVYAASVPSGVAITVSWDTVVANDLLPALTVPTAGFTVAETGTYRLDAEVQMAGSTGGGIRSLQLIVAGEFRSRDIQLPQAAGNVFHCGYTGSIGAGDVLTMQVLQDNGTALAIGGTANTLFSITRLRG